MLPTPLLSLAEVCSRIKGLLCKKNNVNDCTVFYLSEIKGCRENFGATKYSLP